MVEGQIIDGRKFSHIVATTFTNPLAQIEEANPIDGWQVFEVLRNFVVAWNLNIANTPDDFLAAGFIAEAVGLFVLALAFNWHKAKRDLQIAGIFIAVDHCFFTENVFIFGSWWGWIALLGMSCPWETSC